MLSFLKVCLPLTILSVGFCGVTPNKEAQVSNLNELTIPLNNGKNSALWDRIQNALDRFDNSTSGEEDEVLDLSELNIPLNNEKNSTLLDRIQNALDRQDKKQQVAVINEYIDEVITNMNLYVKANGYDSIDIDDVKSSFRWGFISGWTIFDQGKLHGLGSFKRVGDVTVKYEYPNLQLRAQLSFSALKFNYRYEIKFIHIGPRGKAKGSSKNNKFTIDLNLDMITLKAKLNRFKLNTLGSISIKLSGNIFSDLIMNAAIYAATPLIKLVLKGVIEDFVIDLINVPVTYYNNLVCQLLQHCI